MHTQRTIVLVILCVGWNHATQSAEPNLSSAEYRGWSTQCLSNGLVELHVVPEIGGRVVQFKVGEKEFFWVNPQLAGKLPTWVERNM